MKERATRRLDRGWTVGIVESDSAAPLRPDVEIDAQVPGVAHHALVAAGYDVDPDAGDGESAQRWVGMSDWMWRRRLDVEDLPTGTGSDDVLEVEFASIDTIGTIRIDGVDVQQVDNQFHPYRVRLSLDRVSTGVELEIELRSPLRALQAAVERYGDRPVNADGEWGVYSYLRKAACSFGWDWGPKAPSLGLPGEVRMHRWRDATIRAMRPLVRRCDAASALVEVQVDLELDQATEGDGDLELVVDIEGPEGSVHSGRVAVAGVQGGLELEIPQPRRWWPRGHGDQPLYEVRVELRRGDRSLDAVGRWIGLRSVRLDLGEDGVDSGFRLSVNERSILCLGANWIPDGLHPGTADPDRVRTRIGQAMDANFNLLRVWGGGVYESDEFYETCDRHGIMVWQDFMFACATYPEHEEFLASVEREARHQVSRLASHPSIVLWCGGNENLLAYETWGWKERMPSSQSWGAAIFTELLPRIVAELDPSRPFVPDSPWSGSIDRHPNDPDIGDRHTWDLKLEEIRDMVPRFLSEFGHQAPPMRDTIEAAIGTGALSSNMPDALASFAGRQRGWGGDEAQYDRWLVDWFLPANDLDQRLWSMHLLQARAMTFTYEWLRLNRDRCGGVLVWQLNDAWCGHSWSLIDVAGRCKPAWWAARRACRPLMLAFSLDADGVRIGIDNDRDDPCIGEIVVRRMRFDGTEAASTRIGTEVAPRAASRHVVPPEVVVPDDPSGECLVANMLDERAVWFFGKDAWLETPTPRISCTIVDESAGNASITVEAHTFVRDLFLELRGVAPGIRTEDNLVTLFPGERWDTSISGLNDVGPAGRDRSWWQSHLRFQASGQIPGDVVVKTLES